MGQRISQEPNVIRVTEKKKKSLAYFADQEDRL